MDSLNDRVNDLIIKGKIDDILDILEQEAPQYDNEVIILKSNYKDLQENQITGTISDEDLRLEINRLKKSILLLVDRIEDLEEQVSDRERSIKQRPKKKKSNKTIIYAGVGVVILLLIYFLPFSSESSDTDQGALGTIGNKKTTTESADDGINIKRGIDYIPDIIYPENEKMYQPYNVAWEFEWMEPETTEDLIGYHLIISGPGATEPAFDTIVEGEIFKIDDECSHIPQQFVKNWTWKVRSVYMDESVSNWSLSASFDVEDFDENSFCYSCPDLCN